MAKRAGFEWGTISDPLLKVTIAASTGRIGTNEGDLDPHDFVNSFKSAFPEIPRSDLDDGYSRTGLVTPWGAGNRLITGLSGMKRDRPRQVERLRGTLTQRAGRSEACAMAGHMAVDYLNTNQSSHALPLLRLLSEQAIKRS